MQASAIFGADVNDSAVFPTNGRGEKTPTPKIPASPRERPPLSRGPISSLLRQRTQNDVTKDSSVAKYTGGRLVVERAGVLSKVLWLDLSGPISCVYVYIYIYICCEVIIWAKFGHFRCYYLGQVGVIIWAKLFLAYKNSGFKQFLHTQLSFSVFFVPNYLAVI